MVECKLIFLCVQSASNQTKLPRVAALENNVVVGLTSLSVEEGFSRAPPGEMGFVTKYY